MARVRYDEAPSWHTHLRAAKRRFQEIFPRRFADPTYLEWERDYKCAAHEAWRRELGRTEWQGLLEVGAHDEAARRIASLYARSKLNMLALYEWMALREALTDRKAGRALAAGLFDLVHGTGAFGRRLERFTDLLEGLPQRQTRLAKWPVATLFPFVARPNEHMILKPKLVKRAAQLLGFDLAYTTRPNGATYDAFMRYVTWLRGELAPWRPRDLIDLQGFIWVVASEEYETWPWE
jgi:hypothetical protein